MYAELDSPRNLEQALAVVLHALPVIQAGRARDAGIVEYDSWFARPDAGAIEYDSWSRR